MRFFLRYQIENPFLIRLSINFPIFMSYAANKMWEKSLRKTSSAIKTIGRGEDERQKQKINQLNKKWQKPRKKANWEN